MPRTKRTDDEIEAVKADMLVRASDLIAEQGYRGFSMRKLARRLGIAAKTIYNYFHSKDEIYLEILTTGFQKLHDACAAARESATAPIDRLEAMCRAYLDFGLQEANLYNLMFTWHVPKYRDYVGTEMEPTARIELETALQVPLLFIEAVQACAAGTVALSDDEARLLVIQLWTQAHGYVAGINNTLLDYVHDDPRGLQETLVSTLLTNFQWALQALASK